MKKKKLYFILKSSLHSDKRFRGRNAELSIGLFKFSGSSVLMAYNISALMG